MATRPTKDINEATQQDLEQVPQMSSARAETIIHYRDQHGPFEDISQLSAIPGIGDIMAQQMAEFFTVGGSRSGSRSEGEEESPLGSRHASADDDEVDEGEEGEVEGQVEGEGSSGETQNDNQQQRRAAGRKTSSRRSSQR